MRVLLINRNDFVGGGADRVFLNTLDLLQASGEGTEVQIDTFTRRDAGLDGSPDPRSGSLWERLRLARDYLYSRKVAKALDQKIRDFHPDVAHLHLVFGTLSTSVLRVLKKHGIPVVMTVHDYRLICPANAMIDRHGRICERCRGGRFSRSLIHRCSDGNVLFSAMSMLEAYIRKYLVRPIDLVDHFLFVSRFSLDKHQSFDGRFAEKSSHLYNTNQGVQVSESEKGEYFLYFGRLSREKGIPTLVAAARDAGVELRIAGAGPLESELWARLVDHPAPATSTGDVSFVGFKSGRELQRLIEKSSFVVVPSEWYENNPMAIVEAFSLGKPVIGSRIGGIPELVTPETGFLFDSGSAESLAEVLSAASLISQQDYSRMSRACREFAAKEFDRRRHRTRLMSIYREVIEQRRGRGARDSGQEKTRRVPRNT